MKYVIALGAMFGFASKGAGILSSSLLDSR